MNKHGFYSAVGLVGVSVLVHASTLYSVDRLYSGYAVKLQALERLEKIRESSKLQFEYVEAPAKTYPEAPRKDVKKISDRDALNQDLQKDKTLAASNAGPKTRREGQADQLAQRQGAPAPASPEKPEIKPEPEQQEKAPEEKAQAIKPASESLIQKEQLSAEEKPIKNVVEEKKTVPQPPQQAAPESAGLTGSDKITTQETGKKASMGAQLYGLTSFEATGSGMGEYMKNLKEKIWLQWYPYLVFKYPQDYRAADAVISITLNAKGEVTIVKVVEQYGSPVFASFCAEAVQRASPLGEVPQEILALVGKDELEIKFGFHYR